MSTLCCAYGEAGLTMMLCGCDAPLSMTPEGDIAKAWAGVYIIPALPAAAAAARSYGLDMYCFDISYPFGIS